MQRILVAIVDTMANDYAGSVMVVPHPNVGVRLFGDVCKDPQTQISKHVEDYQLVQLGIVQSDLHITDAYEVIITGKQWLAAQQPTGDQN